MRHIDPSIVDRIARKLRRMKGEKLRIEAARALDATHHLDGRGPRTKQARRLVAKALDIGWRLNMYDVAWLFAVASSEE